MTEQILSIGLTGERYVNRNEKIRMKTEILWVVSVSSLDYWVREKIDLIQFTTGKKSIFLGVGEASLWNNPDGILHVGTIK